jgi:hypothetical protein
MNETRTALATIAPDPDLTPADQDFLDNYYKANRPTVISLADDWPAYCWTFESLKQHFGEKCIEFQSGRVADPDYEVNTPALATKGTFSEFIDRLLHAPANDTYVVAHNHTY